MRDLFDAGTEIEVALLAGDERYAPVGSAFEADQHVPIGVHDDRPPGARYGTRFGERHRIHQPGDEWSRP